MRKIIIIFFILISVSTASYCTDAIIESQMDVLNISSFVQEGKNYTKDSMPDLDIESAFKDGLSGKVDNNIILKSLLSLLGKEVVSGITLLREYISNCCYT